MVFPEEFLEELRARTPLARLVGRRVDLTKSGRQHKACCPFHAEKTPSFYVYEDGYHCFGCGAHGDAIAFVMQADGVDMAAAVASLADDAGLSLPGRGGGEDGGKDVHTRASRPAPPGEQPIIVNGSNLTEAQVESILGTAARLLVRETKMSAASVLANGGGRIVHWKHDNWDGGFDVWRFLLEVPVEVYFDLDDRERLETEINAALATAMDVFTDTIEVKITTLLDGDPDWRSKVNRHLSGAGVTNQGRVRSDAVATKQYDGLLFRSRPEVLFYNALKSSGVPFAPLSVVLNAAVPKRRVEPDFILFKEGLAMIVEIDGDLFHVETPSAAHERLKFLTDEGLILEQINATECDTPEKAREAVARVLRTFGKHRKAR